MPLSQLPEDKRLGPIFKRLKASFERLGAATRLPILPRIHVRDIDKADRNLNIAKLEYDLANFDVEALPEIPTDDEKTTALTKLDQARSLVEKCDAERDNAVQAARQRRKHTQLTAAREEFNAVRAEFLKLLSAYDD